jgi:hypothetical protein
VPRIAVVNDAPEVVAMVSAVVTKPGRQFLKQVGATDYTREKLLAFAPEIVIVPLYRRTDTLDRPLGVFEEDVVGARILTLLAHEPALAAVPTLLLGLATREADVPAHLLAAFADLHFLEFPLGLQELNPIISAYVGPAG